MKTHDIGSIIQVFNQYGNNAGYSAINELLQKHTKATAGLILHAKEHKAPIMHVCHTFGFDTDAYPTFVEALAKCECGTQNGQTKLPLNVLALTPPQLSELQWREYPIHLGSLPLGCVWLATDHTSEEVGLPTAVKELLTFIWQQYSSNAAELNAKRLQTTDYKETNRLIEQLKIREEELMAQTAEMREKQVELAEIRNHFQYLFEYSPVGYFTIDNYGRIHEMNQQFKAWFGIEQLQEPMHFSKFLALTDQKAFSLYLREVFYRQIPQEAEFEVAFEQQTYHFQMTAILLPFHEADNLAQVALTDVSQLKGKQAEIVANQHKVAELLKKQRQITLRAQLLNEELQVREEELREQLEQIIALNEELDQKEKLLNDAGKLAKVGGWSIELDTMKTHWTQETFRIHDLPIGTHVPLEEAINYYHPDDRPTVEKAVETLIAKGTPFEFELRLITAKNRTIWVRAKGNRDSINGRPRIYGTFQDITKQKEREKRIADLLRLFELSPDLHSIANFEGYFVELNPAWEETLGYSIEELKAKPFIEFVHPDDRELTLQEGQRLIDEMTNTVQFVNRYRCKDGTYRWLSWKAKPITEDGGKLFCATRDITQERKAQEELKKLALVAQRTDNLVIVTNRSGFIEWVNHGFLRQTGYSLKEVLGKKPGDFLQGDDTDPKEVDKLRNAIRKGESVQVELINYNKNGSAYWVAIDIQPIYDAKGNLVQFFAVQQVVSEKKKKEALLQENLRLLQKTNEELDNFVYRVSHDLRAPISSVLGLIEISRMTDDLPTLQHYLDLQEKSMQKLDTFIGNILDYSRNTRKEVANEPIQFKPLINSVFEEVHFAEEAENIEKRISIQENAAYLGDAYRLKVIFANLISNGIKYAKPYEPHPFLSLHVAVSEKDVTITYEDNGIGIAENQLDKIFQMFYRATVDSRGSGLGLYIVHETVEKLGGNISVQSQLGKGTTFKIILPQQ